MLKIYEQTNKLYSDFFMCEYNVVLGLGSFIFWRNDGSVLKGITYLETVVVGDPSHVCGSGSY
jgi:hypothetical protein